MDYEKKYQEALKAAFIAYKNEDRVLKATLKRIFPELVESKDEKTRKKIISTIHLYYGEPLEDEAKEMIAWLEKQGEQKLIDKVEPKFKVGDFLVNDYCMGKVIELTNDAYLLDTGQGIPFSCEHNVHLWTIQYAKDGDVLSNGKMIVIFKHFEEPSYRQQIVAYIGLDTSGNIQITDDTWTLGIGKIKPATKEQRDTLMEAMADAGYTFDFEKKELKKIEQKSIKTCAEYYNKDRELKMPVLSEFQDKLADILMHREYDGPDETEDDIAKGRLEYELAAIRLSEELLPLAQKEQKPVVIIPKFRIGDEIKTSNEESLTITKINEKGYWSEDLFICGFVDADKWELVEQNPAWSEEDERLRHSCIAHIEDELEQIGNDKYGHSEIISDLKESCRERVKWLKSLKDRVQLHNK